MIRQEPHKATCDGTHTFSPLNSPYGETETKVEPVRNRRRLLSYGTRLSATATDVETVCDEG
jgi:hypothetical protein